MKQSGRWNSRVMARGVTIVELMISLMILSILAVIAVPSMRDTRTNGQVRSVTSDMVAAINTARSQAVNLRVNVRIEPIGGDWRLGWNMVYVYPPAVPRVEEDVSFPQSGDVGVSKNGGAMDMTFQPNGLLAGGATRFEVCGANGTARILDVSPLGRITNTEAAC